MIAGAPLSGPGARALAALLRLHGDSPCLSPALRAAVAAVPAEDPASALRRLLSRRQPPDASRRIPAGPSPAARLLRRLARRAAAGLPAVTPWPQARLAALGARVTPPDGPPPPDPATLGLWIAVWAEPDADRRRALVAAAAPARARWVGHATPLDAATATRLLR